MGVRQLKMPDTMTNADGAHVQACKRTKDCMCQLCDQQRSVVASALLGASYKKMNAIWSPRKGDQQGIVFVGSIQAANEFSLREHGITAVVNCMQRPGLNTATGVAYCNFDIEKWQSKMPAVAESCPQWIANPARSAAYAEAARALFQPVFEFVDAALAQGGNVLIHCFAGAHRAGTTGVAFIMRQEGLSADHAIEAAQRMRPAIDPKAYADLYRLLKLLEDAYRHNHDHETEGEAPGRDRRT